MLQNNLIIKELEILLHYFLTQLILKKTNINYIKI